MKKGIRFLLYTLAIAFPVLLFFSARWFFATWSKVTVSEVIFHLATSLKGTSHSMLRQYALSCALPALLVLAVLLFVSFRTVLSGKKTRRVIMALMAVLLFFDIAYLFNGLDAGEYIRAQMDRSVFVEQQYVDPKDVTLRFPEKKRNLIYIYLESMETTFADPENGGAFPKNVIPELTELAQENEDFSGESAALEGGYSMPGTDWTMGGMFAQTSGLPLLIPIDINAMSTQSVFFPGIVTLGDILHDNGYRQVLLLGSDAVFGGREVYFTSHGGYEMADYPYAIEQGWIPESYNVWWGYEDEKLFAFAKEMLLELSASDEPFNLTFLTTDTHFEDGYICRLCGDEFGDNQYANAYACSSRQVTEFVRWVQEQDFYEDTTIVLCGDHPTMDADVC
ncbi:MAG: sulfatase-like hydrolase/transferase, partial [Lachnospiraceae bacterium]|nr:sulfatase-like hydrolase/transferase [Lachnospiraceae bacterium]